MNKKIKIIIIGLISSLLIIIGLISNKLYLNNILKNKYIIIKNDTYLYEKENASYKKIGKVYKNTVLKVEKHNSSYLKIKDHNYYVKYYDIKKYNNKIKSTKNIYLKTGIKIKTKDNYIIYLNNNKYKFYKSKTYDVYKLDNNYYKIMHDNKLMMIDKKYVENIYGNFKNDTDKIRILYYENVFDDSKICDNNCIKYSEFLSNMETLKENNFKFISIDDFILWKNKKINLSKNSIVIISNIDNNNYLINKDTNKVKFNDDNSICYIDDNYSSRYKIIKKLSNEELNKIIKGKNLYYNKESFSDQKVAVLNYHFFYDPKTEVCNEPLCEPIDEFKKQLTYLKDNNFYILTLDEFRDWMYGEIKIPKKSVLITIDDGAMGTSFINGNKLIPILEEYKMPATLFLISAWWNKENYLSKYLTIQSHGYDIHKQGNCGKAKALCLSKNNLLADLIKSIENSDSNTSFAYPFFSTNESVSNTVKEAGFKLAFVGGNKKATRNDDLYNIPRYQIDNTMDIETFKSFVN